MLEDCHKGEQNEKKEEQRHKEVNWLEYFEGIKHLCPWSLAAYMKDKILHIKHPYKQEMTWVACFRRSKHEALLFEYKDDITVDALYAITEQIEAKYPDVIAFWSHPTEGDQNTPVPCVIVQDRQELTDLRKKVGYTDE